MMLKQKKQIQNNWEGRAGEDAEGMRLDVYIADTLQLLSRSQVKARNLSALLNGKAVKVSRLLKAGDALELHWDDAAPEHIIPEPIPLDIVYEDDAVVVINKAQGMVTHPAAGNWSGTLANALLYKMQQMQQKEQNDTDHSPVCHGLRPGIVHRLDKDTSGIIIMAKNDRALEFLAKQFKERRTRKIYIALVHSKPASETGAIEGFIQRDPRNRKRFILNKNTTQAGKYSITYYKTIWTKDIPKAGRVSLLLLRPKTGRTHQLRVHLKAIGCPIVGDPIYGIDAKDKCLKGCTLMLHAWKLSITLPNGEKKTFKAPLPERFRKFICKVHN
ncbi:MAG: RluA family pseudouridine synthase [Spirochaetaceae bacterium]|jgi:23S rRNA pseudouridine1911/1915/1917 synthase|nr:RluA family pseudouridine synthase [Spirochaetaceae bacterium]